MAEHLRGEKLGAHPLGILRAGIRKEHLYFGVVELLAHEARELLEAVVRGEHLTGVSVHEEDSIVGLGEE
jgi:hypothetical protein